MKSRKIFLLSLGLAALLTPSAFAQPTLINSWENSIEGWGIISPTWTDSGFSTTTGVTDGSYSWMLVASGNPDYSAAIGGTGTTALTALLSAADSVSIDVTVPTGGDFGWYLQWDLTLNQPGGLGYASMDGYTFSQSANIGGQKTLTFSLLPSAQAILAANPTLPTSINFQVGGGGAGTMYLDNLIVTVPEPSMFALAGLGFAALLMFRRR